MSDGGIRTRRARPDDRNAILELCRTSLGWSPDDPDEAFFAWKHEHNVFGESPSWVAEAPDGSLVGLRVFLRWGFVDSNGKRAKAVRAVDTATHPDWRGKGIFNKLTLGAVEELRSENIDFVFNTPNDKSMPGYLKMGWSVVGRVPVAARLGSPRSLPKLVGARTAAELWSEPIRSGLSAAEAFDDSEEVDRLLAVASRPTGLATERSAAFLRWRYQFEPLNYRVHRLGRDLADGIIIYRARKRGSAMEATVCDVIAPSSAAVRRGFSTIARDVRADYLLAGAESVALSSGFLPTPGLGPTLTWRPLARPGIPALSDLSLTLGDIELF